MPSRIPALLVVAAIATAVVQARAATVPAELIAVNENACVQMSSHPETRKLDKFAPADDAKIPAYCSCYSKAYWASVPQADYDGMMSEHAAGEMKGAHSMAIRAALHARNEAAKKSCQ